jgi:hypothetical protein
VERSEIDARPTEKIFVGLLRGNPRLHAISPLHFRPLPIAQGGGLRGRGGHCDVDLQLAHQPWNDAVVTC